MLYVDIYVETTRSIPEKDEKSFFDLKEPSCSGFLYGDCTQNCTVLKYMS